MRAIILAAGMGTRLRPLTNDTPKALVTINNEPMLERQIKFLNDVGIKEIIVVTGYLSEKFQYLKKKFNVKIIFNDKYEKYNNIYSMYLAREYLQDTYVIDGDTYLACNFFSNDINRSTYFSGIKSNFVNEWELIFDEYGKINDIIVTSGQGYIMSGVSYWTKEDGLFLKEKLEEAIKQRDFKQLYWDNIVKENLNNVEVYIEKISGDSWFEIDNLDDLSLLKEYSQLGC